MPYTVYKLIHLVGLALFCYALGGFGRDPERGTSKGLSAAHGGGLFLVLLGGFGMLAKLKLSATTPWVIYKIGVWLALGASIVIFKRKPALATPARLTLALLMFGAAYLGIFHG